MRRFTIDGRWYVITTAAKAFNVSQQLVRDRLNELGNVLTSNDMKKRSGVAPTRLRIEDIKVGSWEAENL